MATITPRRRADNTIGYTAQIRIKRRGKGVYTEAQTFSRHALAADWARRRELELEQPGALERSKDGEPTLAKLADDYRAEFKKLGNWQRSKESALKALARHKIALSAASKLSAQGLVDHVRKRRLDGASPSTAMNDLTWIGVVLKAAKGAWGMNVNPHVVEDARATCRELKLIGKAKERDRRPTADELKKLDEYFKRGDGRLRTPMSDIMWFAIYSGRRQGEITRLLWSDLDEKNHTILVRDVKHPTAKIGNHRVSKLTDEALQIILRQPRTEGEDRIFPYKAHSSIGATWPRACGMCGIVDLHFHDLRHEATSRLFECGYAIHEVAQFTLHESWTELKRYTQLRPEKLQLRQ